MASIYKEIIIDARFAPGCRVDVSLEDSAHRHSRGRPGNRRYIIPVVFSLLREWRRRSLGRAALRHMCADELRDIGLAPAEAAREGCKPFWRP
jgi:uncharacterized protein YjiS (DUF1127 family)